VLVLGLIVAGGVTALLSRSSGGGPGTAPSTQPGTSTNGGQDNSTGANGGQGTGPSSGPSSGSSTAPPPALITLNKDDYIGGDANQVADRLRTLQLHPVRRAAADSEGRPGEVIDLVWQGQLRRGSEIIVIAIPDRGRRGNK
jgi:hypothetical protein